MDWSDDGIVLSVRRHGETSAILSCLTAHHGRHAGLVRGGAGKRLSGLLQPGNGLELTWRGRLPEHLGTYTCDAMSGVAAAAGARFLHDPDRLTAIGAACAVIEAALPERAPYEPVYHGLQALLSLLDGPHWASAYVKWELGLLGALGFGLDFSACAATGALEDLTHVSPKSGCAVSADAAKPYLDRLLTLPPFLRTPEAAGTAEEVFDGLKLTGFFLKRDAFGGVDEDPPARQRLVMRVRSQTRNDSV